MTTSGSGGTSGGGRRCPVQPDGSRRITVPGWYRAGPKGLEYVCGLDEEPGDVTELVRVELDPAAAVEEPLW